MAKRSHRLAGSRGEGFGPRSRVEPGAVGGKRARIVWLHEAGCEICQVDLRGGGACKTPRNVLLREPVSCLAQQDSLSLTPQAAGRKRQASRYTV